MAKANPISDLVDRFGGIRPMQTAIGEKYPNIVQNWLKARRIPAYREDQIRRGIKRTGAPVPDSLLQRIFPSQAA